MLAFPTNHSKTPKRLHMGTIEDVPKTILPGSINFTEEISMPIISRNRSKMVLNSHF